MKVGDLVTDGYITGIVLNVFESDNSTPVAAEILHDEGVTSQWVEELEVVSESR